MKFLPKPDPEAGKVCLITEIEEEVPRDCQTPYIYIYIYIRSAFILHAEVPGTWQSLVEAISGIETDMA